MLEEQRERHHRRNVEIELNTNMSERKAEKRHGAEILMESFKPGNSTLPDASWGWPITNKMSNKMMIVSYKTEDALA